MTLTFDLLTSECGHMSPVPWASLLPIFSLLCSSILDVVSGTGQTDRRTDRQRSSLHNAPTLWEREHNKPESRGHVTGSGTDGFRHSGLSFVKELYRRITEREILMWRDVFNLLRFFFNWHCQ